MSYTSANLGMPYLAAAQAQKHVTVNEALEILDAVAQLTVMAFGAEAPPSTAEDGEVWALGASPTGAWNGQGGKLAVWSNGGWLFVVPQAGWRAASGTELRVFDGTEWSAPQIALQNLDGVGVGASWDATNRLVVASDASLFTHAGAGHQVKINKTAPADTASLLFQSGWSGRAEFGLAGDDDFSVKVSPDGSVWHDVLVADRTTGALTLGQPLPLASGGTGAATAAGARAGLGLGTAATANVTTSATDTTAGRVMTVGYAGLGLVTPTTLAELNAADLGAGFYRTTSLTAGTFPTHSGGAAVSQFGYILILRYDANATAQLYFPGGGGGAGLGAGRMFYRVYNSVGAAWLPWREVITNLNLLGAVSQSAGVPTGAIIQRGSNANGEFVRFADGTQICQHRFSLDLAISSAFMGGFRSTSQGWTFPAAFAASPEVTVVPVNLTCFGAVSANVPGTLQMNWVATAVSSQSEATRTVSLTATGRWF